MIWRFADEFEGSGSGGVFRLSVRYLGILRALVAAREATHPGGHSTALVRFPVSLTQRARLSAASSSAQV